MAVAVVTFDPTTFHRHLLGTDEKQDWHIPLPIKSAEGDDRVIEASHIYLVGRGTYVVQLDELDQHHSWLFIVRNDEVSRLPGDNQYVVAQHPLRPDIFVFGQGPWSLSTGRQIETKLSVVQIDAARTVLLQAGLVKGRSDPTVILPAHFPFTVEDIIIDYIVPGRETIHSGTYVWYDDHLTDDAPSKWLGIMRSLPTNSALDYDSPSVPERYTPYGYFRYQNTKDRPRYIGVLPHLVSPQSELRIGRSKESNIQTVTASPLGYLDQNGYIHTYTGRTSEKLSSFFLPSAMNYYPVIDDIDPLWGDQIASTGLASVLSDALGRDMAGYVTGFYLPSLF